jgi:tape measure domain-containing protein
MSVVANVAINVDASKALQQIKSVDTAVDGLAKSAAAVPAKISGGLDGLGNKLQSLGGKFATFGGAIASLGAGAALKGFLDAGIAADRTGKTITALAGSYKEVAGVNKIANEAAKEFGLGQTTAAKSVADLYGRLRPMGISLENIGKTFNGVNKAAGLMNLSAADTEGVMLQLSQAMGSGALQGDELRSIMERLPAVGQAVARVMGVTVGEVKKLGSDGKITTDIIIKAMEELNKLKPPPPDAVKLYTAAMEDLQTSIGTKLLPVFTPFLQALTKLIEGFSALPQPLQNVIVGIGGLLAVVTLIAAPLGFLISGIGSLMTALAAAKIGATIAGWAALAGPAITAISAAFSGLLAFLTGTLLPGLLAFFSGPVGWTVLAVAAVVAMVIAFREPLGDFLNWLWNWGKPISDFWAGLWKGLVDAVSYSMKAIGGVLLRGSKLWWSGIKTVWTAIGKGFTTLVVDPISKAWTALNKLLPDAMKKTGDMVSSVWTGIINSVKNVFREMLNFIVSGINRAVSAINYLIDGYNRIPVIADIPRLGILSVPAFAEGGIVDRPTLALVGEGGEREFIIPESKMAATAANYLSGSGSSAPASSGGGSTGNAQISITTGPVLQQGGEQYVTLYDLERAMQMTADGVYKSLRTSSGRYATGVR